MVQWKTKSIEMQWHYMAESRYQLHEIGGQPLAVIVFCRTPKVWHISLVQKYEHTTLETKLVDEAKEFAEGFLNKEDLTNAEWQEINKISYALNNLEEESLAILEFNADDQKWDAKVLKREYQTMLGTEIGLDQPEKVKKLTEELIKAEQSCHYKYVLNNFKKENKMPSAF